MLKPPSAVIVGTGHHGSGYLTAVLREAGIHCGHETYYGFHHPPREVPVDSSWVATGHLEGYEGIVWHQVRDPLKVVTSFADTLMHHSANKYGQWRRKLTRPFVADPVINAMATYVDINSMAEQYASKRWKVEEFNSALLIELAEELEASVSPYVAELAIRAVSKKTNQHTRAMTMDWKDLPDVPVKAELLDMAARYGY